MLLSLPRGTQMFQFPRFPPLALCVQARVTPHDGCGVSPFGHPRIEAWSAAPRGFSQPPTSFIGIRRQGIHRWLFVAWISSSDLDARACSSVLKGRVGPASSELELRPSRLRGGKKRPSPEAGARGAPSKRNRGGPAHPHIPVVRLESLRTTGLTDSRVASDRLGSAPGLAGDMPESRWCAP